MTKEKGVKWKSGRKRVRGECREGKRGKSDRFSRS